MIQQKINRFIVAAFLLLFSIPCVSEETKNWQQPSLPIINCHEHIQSEKEALKMIRVMDQLGIEHTILVGSPRATIYKGQMGFKDYDPNNREVIEISRRWPERFMAFATLNPRDPDKFEKLKKYLAEGARGLKLYSGHTLFYDMPLNDSGMTEVYEFCEKNNVPVIFHVNAGIYLAEFEAVLKRFPRLKVNCPHFCLSSIALERLEYLLETYPNLWTDISFGAPEFLLAGLRRISRDPEKYRRMIQKYPKRFLYGTDTVVTQAGYKTEAWLEQAMGVYRDLLEKESYRFFLWDQELQKKDFDPDEKGELKGLHLGEEILRKIYRDNATAFLS